MSPIKATIYFGEGDHNVEMHKQLKEQQDTYWSSEGPDRRPFVEQFQWNLKEGRRISFIQLPSKKSGVPQAMTHTHVTNAIVEALRNAKKNAKKLEAKGVQPQSAAFLPQDVVIGRGKTADGTREGTERYRGLIQSEALPLRRRRQPVLHRSDKRRQPMLFFKFSPPFNKCGGQGVATSVQLGTGTDCYGTTHHPKSAVFSPGEF